MLSNEQKLLSNYILFTLESDTKAKQYANKCGLGYTGQEISRPHFLLSHFVSSTVDYYLNDGLRGHALRHKLRKEYGIPIIAIIQLVWLVAQIVIFILERWNQETAFLNNDAVQEIFNDNFGPVQNIWESHKDYTLRDAVEHFMKGLAYEGNGEVSTGDSEGHSGEGS